jgi:hypothetical protein
VVKGLDDIDDFFNLLDQVYYRFFRSRHLNGDAVHTRDSTFGGSKGVDVDASTGKNDRDPVENPNEIFGDDK